MPVFYVETVATSPIREYWKVEAANAEEAAEVYGERGEFLYDEVLGEEEGRTVDTVHPEAALAGFFAGQSIAAEAPAMLAALRKISQGADCFTFNSDADAFRFVDMVAEAVAPILARIDGAAPAPTAQPAAPSVKVGEQCASCGAEEGESHGAQCEARAFAAGAAIKRGEG